MASKASKGPGKDRSNDRERDPGKYRGNDREREIREKTEAMTERER
jgi:hypothetical protein